MERQMIGSSENLLVYYLGLGFATLLGWVIFAPDPGLGLSRQAAARYLRWAPFVGIVGVLHPALGFAARDIVDQVGIELPDDRELAAKHARVSSFVNASAMVSLVVTPVVLVVNLGL
jgi:hypothetical protein